MRFAAGPLDGAGVKQDHRNYRGNNEKDGDGNGSGRPRDDGGSRRAGQRASA
jgi:hypothetical protein